MFDWVSSAYEGTKKAIGGVGKVAGDAKAVASALGTVLLETHDPPKIVSRFIEALPAVAPLADKKADAIAIGTLGEAGAVIFAGSGAEMLYVRPKDGKPARLQVSALSATSAKANLAVGTRAFLHCFYGDPDALLSSPGRSGGEAGILIASFGAFRVQQPEGATTPAPVGWATGLGAGIGIGVPLLSELGTFEIKPEPKLTVFLTPEETATIEAHLSASPDRSAMRALANKLAS
jgi:hypothetical protein